MAGTLPGSEHYILHASSKLTPPLIWTVYGPGGGVDHSFPLPFDVPTSVMHWAARKFIVSGYNTASSSGVLAILELGPAANPTVTTVASQSYPGLDPSAFYWNDGEARLYVFDFLGQRLLWAPFAPPALPDASSWTEIPVDAEPGLVTLFQTRPIFVRLRYPDRVSANPAVALMVEKKDPDPMIQLDQSWHVYESGGTWSFQKAIPFTTTSAWHVRDRGKLSVNAPIEVSGHHGAFEIVDVDTDAVVATGSTANETSWYSVPPPPGGFAPGAFYRLRTAQGPTPGPAGMSVYVRYGIPMENDHLELHHGRVGPATVYVSDQRLRLGANHRVVCRLSKTSPPLAGTIAAQAYLWIGVRDAQGVDPYLTFGPNNEYAALSELAGVLGPVGVSVTRSFKTFSFEFPVPDNGDLEGLVVLWQAVAVVGEEALVSDVFGSAVFAQPSGPSGTAAQKGRGPGPLDGERRNAAGRKWLMGLPGAEIDAREREIWHRVLRR